MRMAFLYTAFFLLMGAMAPPVSAQHEGSVQLAAAQDDAAPGAKNDFDQRAASEVIDRIRNGLQGHSRGILLSVFDSAKMPGYRAFQDQITSYFDRYESFRVHLHIVKVAMEGTRGVVLVDADLEATPPSAYAPVRKRAQLRFELEHNEKGWRVVKLNDRGFFS